MIKFINKFSINPIQKKELIMKPDSQFNLVKEMLETAVVIKNFDFSQTAAIAEEIKKTRKLMLTGEGSSRIFPAKNLMYLFQKKGVDVAVNTDGAYQAAEYDLSKSVVMVASNSGKTKEAVTLIKKLQGENHQQIYGVTATANTPIADLPNASVVLSCGPEEAVTATKSVVEQALVYQSVLTNINGCKCMNENREKAAVLAEQIMLQEYDAELI
jgi:glucosamine--fructose-6-phosphate aminotransferase (isomerizing)